MPFERIGETLQLRLPDVGGPLTLVTSRGVESGPVMTVSATPVIASVHPDPAHPGEELTIRGSNLDQQDMRVLFGDGWLDVQQQDPGRIVILLPPDAISAPLRLTVPGTATERPLEVLRAFSVEAERTGTFYPGDRIELRFVGADEGHVEMEMSGEAFRVPLEGRGESRTFLVPELPDETDWASFSVVDGHGRRRRVNVIAIPPELFRLDGVDVRRSCERDGPPNEVVISGSGFNLGRTRVRWGSRRLPVLHVDRTEIRASMPVDAEGRHPLIVANARRRFRTEPPDVNFPNANRRCDR